MAAAGILMVLLASAGPAPASSVARVESQPAGEAASPQSLSPATNAKLWGTVRAVLNGKGLVVVTQDLASLSIKLLGVELPEQSRARKPDAPLVPGQPFGQQAVRFIRDLLVDKQVRLETYGKDRLGRILAVVWLGDVNVNLSLVKEGLAWVSPSLTVSKVRAELEVAERQAQVGKYGLWALPNPEAPWHFRKRYQLPAQ